MDLAPILAGAISAAERAGELLRAEFLRPEGPRGGGHKAPVDDEMESFLREALCALLPCTFVGEEGGVFPGSVERFVWMVDPHDATSEFLKGQRGSAVSVALLEGAEAVLGVVVSPFSPDRGRDTIAWAKGCGPLRRNGVAVAPHLGSAQLASGLFVFASAGSPLRPHVYSRAVAPARYVAMPSIAYRLARVAAGDGVATLTRNRVHEWDVAAGAALVRAAGGVLLDNSGREVTFTGTAEARIDGCMAGGPQAVARLAAFDWSMLATETRASVRTATAFPKCADDVRLARAQGCLLGQLAGDSLGSLVEFDRADAIATRYPYGVRDLADGGPWHTIAGQPTDDSEMALALARSIVREGGFVAAKVLDAYRRWFASMPFNIGGTTRTGLTGPPSVSSEANGSLMRVAPIGIWAAGDPARAAQAARDDSRFTHPNPVCVEACAGYVAAIAAGIAGADRDAMLACALEHATGAAREAIERGAAGSPPADFDEHLGWVLIALQNAFYRLMHAATLEEAIVATVGAGGDTDTNAAIAGALAGAVFGRDAFPQRWMLPLLACRSLAEAGARRPRAMDYWPDDVLALAEALLAAGTAHA